MSLACHIYQLQPACVCSVCISLVLRTCLLLLELCCILQGSCDRRMGLDIMIRIGEVCVVLCAIRQCVQ
jgi:hypothetical protein